MLKKLLFFLIILSVLVSTVKAQSILTRRTLEASVSASFQLFSENDNTETFINIPLRLGFFITPRWEVEAEFAITKPQSGDAGYILSGLLSYNFRTPGGIMPFAFAGYGVTNSIPVITNNVVANIPDATLGVLSLGGGVKIPIGSKAALRSEYRFQNFTGSQGNADIDFQVHSLFTGISLFLP